MPLTKDARRRGRPPGISGGQLLAIARSQFLAQGFRGTTMDAIAARAGISKQTLYAAYPSKDALYAAVVHDWVDQGHDALRPHALALTESADVNEGLRRFANMLQTAILSPPVLQMRTLVAAESAVFPEVARDYVTRSWDRNIDQLAGVLTTLSERGALAIEHAQVAAEQFVWLAIGAPLNRISLRGSAQGDDAHRLEQIATEAAATFLSRYGSPQVQAGRTEKTDR